MGEDSKPTIEIRIHGVGGEEADGLLDDPHPRLVAGDHISGFYEPHEDHPWLDKLPGGRRRRQALCWGGNTSGSWRNALWILLLPFALVNVTGFMHRPHIRPMWRIRWFGLTLTLSTVMLAAATSYDLIAIQCGRVRACAERVDWLSPFLWQFNGRYIFEGFPSRRLGLATVIPAALLTLLWFAGRYAYKDLEAYLDRRMRTTEDEAKWLTDPGFWNGYEPTFRTRLIHLTAGRAAIAGTLAWCLFKLGADRTLTVLLMWLAGAVLIGTAIAIVLHPVYSRRPSNGLKSWLARLQITSWLALGSSLGLASQLELHAWLMTTLKVLALALFVAWGVKLLRPLKFSNALLHVVPLVGGFAAAAVVDVSTELAEPSPAPAGDFYAGLFPAPYQLAWLIGGIQALLIIAMLFSPTRRELRSDQGQPYGPGWTDKDSKRVPFHGFGAPTMATLAVFMVLAVGSGVHRGIASLAAAPRADQAGVVSTSDEQVGSTAGAGSSPPPSQGGRRMYEPWWYETTAHILVVFLLLLAINGWRFSNATRRYPTGPEVLEAAQHLESDVGMGNVIKPDDPDDRDRLRRVVYAWRSAQELVRIDLKLFWSVVIGFVLALVLFLVQLPSSTPLLGPWLAWRPEFMGRPFGPIASFSLWVVGLLPVLSVFLLRLAASNQRWRRQIGRVWDVLMFWPRHIHPFAPPCYAERVVPQLRLHIDRTRKQGNKVVVAGHSQGSVIAVAAVAMPPMEDKPDTTPGLDLVVYGSPIAILYERYFPAYFGSELFQEVDTSSGRWHHFFARTDVFAYPFWSAGSPPDVTRPCPVCSYWPFESPVPPPAPHHTDYVVVDPERWVWPTQEPPPPRIEAHSTYHTGKHRRFEEHLQRISAT